jgi:hypothetical protein
MVKTDHPQKQACNRLAWARAHARLQQMLNICMTTPCRDGLACAYPCPCCRVPLTAVSTPERWKLEKGLNIVWLIVLAPEPHTPWLGVKGTAKAGGEEGKKDVHQRSAALLHCRVCIGQPVQV